MQSDKQHKLSSPTQGEISSAERKGMYLSDNRGLDNPVQRKANNTGLPDNLKSGIENLSGHSMDDVKVHYNSSQPAQLNAHAYAQGNQIHVAPGQEKHVAHEAWHVVQQKQGRVKPTTQLKEKAQQKASGVHVIQRNAIKMADDLLTKQMKERFTIAYDKFSSTILAASPLATEANNHVVVRGTSQGSSGMKDYGSTTLWIGNDGYKGDDYNKFSEVWATKLDNEIPHDVAVRVVIAVNLTKNTTVQEIYATLLHEWYVHAVKWTGAIGYIRGGKGRFALAWIKGQGHERRGKGEHKQYANMSDEHLEQMVDSMGLKDDERATVLHKLKADRNRHDKNTGEVN